MKTLLNYPSPTLPGDWNVLSKVNSIRQFERQFNMYINRVRNTYCLHQSEKAHEKAGFLEWFKFENDLDEAFHKLISV